MSMDRWTDKWIDEQIKFINKKLIRVEQGIHLPLIHLSTHTCMFHPF